MPPTHLGKYELLKRIGHGGMGVLYLAHDPDLDRSVAIKVMRADFSAPDADQRFAREARALARLKHPNIVRVFDFGRADEQWYFVMEYIVGPTLADLIEQRTPLSLDARLGMFDQICAAVAHAHEHGWIHRDLKPRNVMIDSEDHLVKVLDFGLARQFEVGLTQQAGVMGSPGYMSPEQAEGRPVDIRTDVFSASAILYELLTYRRAFPGDQLVDALRAASGPRPQPPSKVDPSIPPEIDAIVSKGLAAEVDRRYPDMRAYREALSHESGIVFSSQAGRTNTLSRTGDVPPSAPPRGNEDPTRIDPPKAAPPAPLPAPSPQSQPQLQQQAERAANPAPAAEPRSSMRIAAIAGVVAAVVIVGAGVIAWRMGTGREPNTAAVSPTTVTSTVPAQVERSNGVPKRSPEKSAPVARAADGTATTPKAEARANDPAADRSAITAVLAQYAVAYNRLDADAVAALMADPPVDDLRQSFSRYSSFELTLEPTTITITGDTATAVCRETKKFKPIRGDLVALPAADVSYAFARRGGGWVIVGSRY